MAKITLNEMQREVQGRRLFEGNSVFSRITDNLYVVYSYGYHFPMYVYDYAIGKWIGNSDKYSTTTSRHQSKCNPNDVEFWLDTDELKHMIGKGGFVEYKLREDV